MISENLGQINRKNPPHKRGFLFICFLGINLFTLTSCHSNYSPKPTAYPRISYPQNGYLTCHPPYLITFEYPAIAKLESPNDQTTGGHWINLNFERFRATLFTSYFQESKEKIQQHILENESILEKETPPFAHIHKQEYLSSDKKITGYLYEIDGNTASPVQFILTDNQQQLFRGALYFDYIPNRDSIVDILDGLKGDIRYLMESFRFKK